MHIDKDIPIPAVHGKGRPQKYPFAHMSVGDSILIPVGGQEAAAKWKRRHPGWNYVSRRENGGVRVWRIE